MVSFQENERVAEARAKYFAANDFGADGGYGDAWVDFSLGPIPFPFPNSPMRVAAVRYHDLHHIVTGYETDLPGELEISAWEIGAGCGRFVVPWQLNLAGMGAGMLFMPRRLFAAFVRGRRSRSLYGADFEPLLDKTVAELRSMTLASSAMGSSAMGSSAMGDATMGDAGEGAPARGRAGDGLLFALAVTAGLAVGLLSLAVGLLTLPLGLAAQLLRRRAQAAA